jgi:hypothetical protein
MVAMLSMMNRPASVAGWLLQLCYASFAVLLYVSLVTAEPQVLSRFFGYVLSVALAVLEGVSMVRAQGSRAPSGLRHSVLRAAGATLQRELAKRTTGDQLKVCPRCIS